MKKALIVGIILVVFVVGGIWIYVSFFRGEGETGPLLPNFQNPFNESPASSFRSTEVTPTFANPFASPTPTTYQNPFGNEAGEVPYQNPFEKLR